MKIDPLTLQYMLVLFKKCQFVYFSAEMSLYLYVSSSLYKLNCLGFGLYDYQSHSSLVHLGFGQDLGIL
jgi:hypothetical protein